jgi:hypothetical protein
MAMPDVKNTVLPEALLAEVRRLAKIEQRSPDELVQEAVERLLRLKRRERLYAYGEEQARRLGIQESDVQSWYIKCAGKLSANGSGRGLRVCRHRGQTSAAAG